MRAKTAKWFECKVRYEQTQENGMQKMVTEQFVVDAMSFAEAEARIIQEMSAYINGDFDVTDVKIAPYKEIFFMNGGETILANEEEKMSRAMKRGKVAAMEQYDKKIDFNPDNADIRYYKAKLQFITYNDRTDKEKRQAVTYLVEASSLRNALNNIDKVMVETMTDYVQASVSVTAIIDVFEHHV